MRLHTHIQSQQEVGEVHSYAESVAEGYLLVEFVELKHTAGLVFIFSYGPDVSGIDKCAEFEHPEEFGAILQIEVEANIAALIDEAVDGVGGEVAAGA